MVYYNNYNVTDNKLLEEKSTKIKDLLQILMLKARLPTCNIYVHQLQQNYRWSFEQLE